MVVTLKPDREREREGGVRMRRRPDQTIEHARHGPVNRQESWEMLLAFRIAHSVSQFKTQHIQLNLFLHTHQGPLKLIHHTKMAFKNSTI